VLEEPEAQALALAGTLDETGNVGHDELGVVVAHDAQVGFERGERVVGDLRLGGADDADERALAHVGEADQRDVGHELQLQLQPLLVALLALLGERGGPAAVGGELGVAAAAAATAGRKPAVAVVGQVGEQLAGVQIGDDGALGHHHLQVLAALAVLVLAHSVHAVERPAVRMVAERQQRRHVAAGHQPDVAALAAVAAIGPTEGHRPFTAERHTARATVASAHVELGLVDKSAHRTLRGYR
jgi:hypothetical protein